MKLSARSLVGLIVSSFMLAGISANPAEAQDKTKAAPSAKAEKGKATQKVLLDNDKVLVFEATFKPGDVGAMAARPYRIIRVLQGGTLERTYADGKTEKVPEWKTGEVREVGPDPAFAPKNTGKTTLVLYIVNLKQAK